MGQEPRDVPCISTKQRHLFLELIPSPIAVFRYLIEGVHSSHRGWGPVHYVCFFCFFFCFRLGTLWVSRRELSSLTGRPRVWAVAAITGWDPVFEATGMSRITVRAGLKELDHWPGRFPV